jgi:hypothetical protein
MRRNALVFFLFFSLSLIGGQNPAAFGCDSSVLEILTGTSVQNETIARILAISQKIQQAAAALKAFNHASAKRMHHEAMEHWLYVASRITAEKLAPESKTDEFSNLMVAIAGDLGNVRRSLEKKNYDYLHEILEACITRMSLVAALMEKKSVVAVFLRFELEIYSLRPFFGEPDKLRVMSSESRFADRLHDLQGLVPPDAVAALANLGQQYERFADSLKKNDAVLDESHRMHVTLVNSFVQLKGKLIDSGFFRSL